MIDHEKEILNEQHQFMHSEPSLSGTQQGTSTLWVVVTLSAACEWIPAMWSVASAAQLENCFDKTGGGADG